MMVLRASLAMALVAHVSAHGAMTFPKPRNSLDGSLDLWKSWNYPCKEGQKAGECGVKFCSKPPNATEDPLTCVGTCPVAAYNGQENQLNGSLGQACYWFSNGCTVGCDRCDGTSNHVGHGGQSYLYKGMNHTEMLARNISLPNPWNPEPGTLTLDPKTKSGLKIRAGCDKPTAKPTVCDPRLRTANTQAECGGPDDVYYYSPWRYPGNAPVIDSCGSAGGRFPGQGDGGAGAVFQNSSAAVQGDMGSKLPPMPSQATVRAGGLLETGWTVMANHGGGYAYRLAPADGPLTEEEFRKTPLNFVGLSALRWDGDKAMQETFNTTELGWETDRGTIPEGSTWRKVPIPSGIWRREGPQFEPVCQESEACIDATRKGLEGILFKPQGVCRCSGYSNGGPLLPNVEMVDTVRIPAHLKPGKYVLQWRWDCEESDQVWASCSDISISAH